MELFGHRLAPQFTYQNKILAFYGSDDMYMAAIKLLRSDRWWSFSKCLLLQCTASYALRPVCLFGGLKCFSRICQKQNTFELSLIRHLSMQSLDFKLSSEFCKQYIFFFFSYNHLRALAANLNVQHFTVWLVYTHMKYFPTYCHPKKK